MLTALYNLGVDYDAVIKRNDAATTLAAMRVVVGIATWAAPGIVGKIVGLQESGDSRYLWRIFGIRDAVLGIGVLASQGETRKMWLKAGIVCDISDAMAAIVGGRSGTLPARTSASLTAPAVMGIFMGLAGHKLEG